MSENNKIEKFLKKIAPCIERGELDTCVDEAISLADEMGIDGEELLGLSSETRQSEVFNFAYVLAFAAAQRLEGIKMAEAHYYAGHAAQHLGNVEQVEEQYKKSIKAYSKNAAAHSNYAIMLQELNRQEEAEEHYKLAIDAAPENVEPHSNYAILLKKLKRPKEAKMQYKLAIDADPKNAVTHFNYAILLEELKSPEEAEEQYKLAIDANPKLAVAHINYANLLRKKVMFSEAEHEIRIALKIEPNSPYALGTYGDILADEDYLEEAKEKYREAIKNSDSMARPSVAENRNNLGWAYTHLGQYDRAKKEFEEAHKLDPQNVKAFRNLRALRKVKSEPKLSKIQIWAGCGLFIAVIATWILFLKAMISENVFVAQSTFLIAILIFILFYHQLNRFKAGPIEFEKSTGHRSQPIEMLSKIER